jgi:hypothetical protein
LNLLLVRVVDPLQFTIPMTVCIALFIAALMMAYNRLFAADYRDLVKELQILLPTASQQVTCEQHIALWTPPSSPSYSTVSDKLREWPHEAYREHIVDMLRVAGVSDTELDETRQRLIVRAPLPGWTVCVFVVYWMAVMAECPQGCVG